MTSRPDEVKACMNPQIALLLPVRLLFLSHIRLMLIIHEVDNRHPRITVVHVVTESRSVDDSKLDLELFLFKFSLDNLDFSEFVELLLVTAAVVARRGEFGGEKCVDEGCLPKTGLACVRQGLRS